MSRVDLECVLNEVIDTSRHLLQKRGELAPFGGGLRSHGVVDIVMVDPGEDCPGEVVVRSLAEILSRRVGEGRYSAVVRAEPEPGRRGPASAKGGTRTPSDASLASFAPTARHTLHGGTSGRENVAPKTPRAT